MQNVIVEGYLAADPQILTALASGKTRATFRLLETVRFRRGDGQPGERTTGFNCVCFNETTTEGYIGRYAKKGARVVVSGHVENDTWTGQDGVTHYDLRLVVEDVRIKSRRNSSAPRDAEPPEADLDQIPF